MIRHEIMIITYEIMIIRHGSVTWDDDNETR